MSCIYSLCFHMDLSLKDVLFHHQVAKDSYFSKYPTPRAQTTRRGTHKWIFVHPVVHEKCNSPIFARIILINYHVCLYALVCDHLFLYVFYSGLVDFALRRIFWSFWNQRYFGYLVSRGKIVFWLWELFLVF